MVKSIPNIFTHGRKFEQGVGKVRLGQATVVVALDGTGDTENIQEGIDLLPSNGGVVYIKEGTYIITEAIIINSDDIKIQGSGASTIIKQTTATEQVINATGTSGTHLNKIHIENIRVEGTTIDGDNQIHFEWVDEGRIINCWTQETP